MNLFGSSISEAKDIIKNSFLNALDKKQTPANVFLHGSMGIGKSSSVFQTAEEISKLLDVDVVVIDIRLSAMESSDVQGIPYVSEVTANITEFSDGLSSDTRTIKEMFFSTPSWWPKDDGKIYILFLDELTNATKSVQQSSYRLILDRSCQSGATLPPSTLIIGAGNLTTDGTGAKELLPALANRFSIHLLIDKEKVRNEFVNWAMHSNTIDIRILSFLNHKKERICENPAGPAFGTPRSWEQVHIHLNNDFFTDTQRKVAIAGAVGMTNMFDFNAYLTYIDQHPDWDKVRAGEEYNLPEDDDVAWSVCTPLAYETLKSLKDADEEAIKNLCSVVKQLSSELKIVFFKTLKTDSVVASIFKYPELKEQFKTVSHRI